MTQTSNKILDDIARLMTDAAGAAQGVRKEVEATFRAQAERFMADLDVVRREEFDVVRAMAERAREENERLLKRLRELEAEIERLKAWR